MVKTTLADGENAVATPTTERAENPLPARLPHRFSAATLANVADVLAANLLAERERERGHD